LKVFLDTSVLVAAFATRGLCADVFRLVLAAHELCVSETVLAELERGLRDKVGLPESPLRSVRWLVREHATLAKEVEPTVAVRDPSDQPILSAALGSGAEVMVTGDRDLLELDEPVPLRIVTPRGFWELAKAASQEGPGPTAGPARTRRRS
jgi:putative PIN family toxin of toxin-antitoxin system